MLSQTPHRGAEEHRAADDLQFIRHAMERANRFHAVPGVGLVIMGATAIAAAGLATLAPTRLWLPIWVGDAVLAVCVGLVTMYRKARSVNLPVASPSGQAFLLSFSPPIAAGIVITLAFTAHGVTHLLPGMWLILYGLAALTGGAANSWMLANRGPQMSVRDWRAGFTVDLQQKDVRLVLEAADELGVPLPATALVFQLYRAVQHQGLGSEGQHALVKALEFMMGAEMGQAPE